MGFPGTTNGARKPFVISDLKRQQRRRPWRRLAATTALCLLAAAAIAPPAGAQANITVVANPGDTEFTVTGGVVGLGGVNVPLPPCDPEGNGCLSFTATVDADGRFSVADSDLQLPRIDLPLEQLGVALPIGLSVETYITGVAGGLLSPGGRLVRFELGFGVRLLPDLSSLGNLSFLARGASCGIGPVQLSLTSGGSGSVTGVPYDPETGAATLVDGSYSVPALTCSPLIAVILPLLAGDVLAGVDLADVLSTANQTLSLPSQPGENAVAFDVVISRVVGEAMLPLGSGGLIWPDSGFDDVPTSAPFDQAVRWLKAHGITTGLGGSSTTFGAGAAVNRGQMAAFLWRMMDRRAAPVACGFGDVSTTAFFSRSVCWLKDNDITTGVAGTSSFAPARELTRGEMASFLWRLAGRPPGSPPSSFNDLASGAAYAPAVAWLAANNITTGINNDPTKFAPGATVTRAQMALFLHRLASSDSAWDPSVGLPTTVLPIGLGGGQCGSCWSQALLVSDASGAGR